MYLTEMWHNIFLFVFRLLRLAGRDNFDYNQFKDNMATQCLQPHIHIAKNTTREVGFVIV